MNFSDLFEQIELVDDKVIEVLDEIATLREVAKELMLNSYKNAASKEMPKMQEIHSEEERRGKAFRDSMHRRQNRTRRNKDFA